MSTDSNNPFAESISLQKMAKSVERIELRLVGDPELQSTGLVQEVTQLQKQQVETAKILERVVERLDERDKMLSTQLVSREDLITKVVFRRWVAAALVVMPAVGGVLTWLWNSGMIHIALSAPKHP